MASDEHDKERWECLYGSKFLYKAEILKSLLEENDIQSVIINKQDSAYHFGDIEVYVKLDDMMRGHHILKSFTEDE
ncbi:MAG: DUF2007 domain-containing protein [Bacteroidales bacterium]|nr:DUF2007 domain-containing protein [Bacteroidales bacterium]